MTDREVLSQFGQSVVAEIVQRHIAAGQQVTGKFARSLRHESDDRRLMVIDGAGYSQYLETGRGPTKSKSGGEPSLVDNIRDWVKARGIQGKPYTRKDGSTQEQEKANESLVWAIAQAIHTKGTLLFQRSGNTGIISSVITEQRVAVLTGVFADRYATKTLSDLKKAFA